MNDILIELNDHMFNSLYINKYEKSKNIIFYKCIYDQIKETKLTNNNLIILDNLKKSKNIDIELYKTKKNEFIEKELYYKLNSSDISINDNKDIDYFEPINEDKIFWCFYIILNGHNNYELCKNSYFKEEKDFKIKSIEALNKIKDELKNNKLKITEIKNELGNENKITIKGLYSLCILHKINIMYIKITKGIYYNCFGNKDDTVLNPYIIIENQNKIFILNNNSIETINLYKNKYYLIENISKPVKGISNYTLSDIQELCNKVNIPLTNNNKKITKLELYDAILCKLE